jgi:hypothetical protein
LKKKQITIFSNLGPKNEKLSNFYCRQVAENSPKKKSLMTNRFFFFFFFSFVVSKVLRFYFIFESILNPKFPKTISPSGENIAKNKIPDYKWKREGGE